MKSIITILLLFSAFYSFSQDYIVRTNGDKIKGKITNIDSTNIYIKIRKNGQDFETFINKEQVAYYEVDKSNDSTKIANKFHCMLNYSICSGVNASGGALTFYGYYRKMNNQWFFPYIIGLEFFEINSSCFKGTNYKSIKMGYYMPGFSAFRSMTDRLNFSLGLQIPVGSEELEDSYGEKKNNFIIGTVLSQGIYFIPLKYGISLGVGCYEKFLTSEIYDTDLGFKIDIGLKF